nr:1-acyl-sn-glycerol-3-phosphate acyltransferase [Bacteroidota bacterium]
MSIENEYADKKFIDIDKIFLEKNARLHKMIPGFILRYLKKITRQEQVNYFISKYGHLRGLAFVDAIITEFKFKYKVIGEENILEHGSVMFVANHPLGGLDGISLLQVLGRHRPEVKFIVNDILTKLKNLEDLFVGVNKHGNTTREMLQELDQVFASDGALLIFPAGLVSRRTDGVICDLEWKKAFIAKARKYKKTVVPIHISGHLTNYFYGLSNFRKKIGIKANIEMLYLPDEMYKQEHLNVTITIGKAIDPAIFDKSKTDEQWAQWMKDKVYELAPKEN